MDLSFATMAEAAELIRARKLSPIEYADFLLRRIAALEPQLNAFITVTADLAREQARQAEQEITAGRHRGPLHGIPLALKDIYATRGIPTTGGSKVGIGNVPSGNEPRLNGNPPVSEIGLYLAIVLPRSERFAALPQYVALWTGLLGVALVARRLGLPRRGEPDGDRHRHPGGARDLDEVTRRRRYRPGSE